MPEEKMFFDSSGLKLCGILNKSGSKHCVVICHGITDSKKRFDRLAKFLADNSIDSLRFDLRAHGESEGKDVELTIAGAKEDIGAAVIFLKQQGYEKFTLLAASFSGGPALLYAAENQADIKSLVLLCALIDYASILNPKKEWLKYLVNNATKKMDKIGYVKIFKNFKLGKAVYEEMKITFPWKVIDKLELPILFIHGDKDITVPHEDSVMYSKIAKSSTLKIIKGAGHTFSRQQEAVAKEVLSFLIKNQIYSSTSK